MLGTAIATSARALWRMLERQGIDPATLFKEAGLDPEQLSKARARYPIQKMRLAWSRASEDVSDCSFGLSIAGVWQPPDFHALGCAFLASSTLRDALNRLVRYHAVVSDMVSYEFVECSDHAVLSSNIRDEGIGEPPILEDARWALILDACRRIYGATLDPLAVNLRHSRPDTSEGAFYTFFRCPVQFGESVSSIVFPAEILDKPLPASNHEVAVTQDRVLREYLGSLQSGDTVSRVKSIISDKLASGNLTSEAAAQALHMTSRSLQRKLAAEETTFSKLVEAVRKELAESYLADDSLTLMEISYLLGFSEHSSFSRAFKRWTGSTPQEFRNITQ
jgi:AraC-like DNA-binding protein